MLRARLEELLRSTLWEALVRSGTVFGDWHYSGTGGGWKGGAQNVILGGPRERTTGEGVTTTSHTPDDPKGSADLLCKGILSETPILFLSSLVVVDPVSLFIFPTILWNA